MNKQKIAHYKARFEEFYPQQAKSLAAAKSVEEQIVIYERIISEARDRVRQAVSALDLQVRTTDLATVLSALDARHDKDKVSQAFIALKDSLAAGDTSETAMVPLNPATLALLTNARGSRIEIEVQKILDGVDRLSKMTDNDAIEVSLEIIGFGAVSFGVGAGLYTLYQLMALDGYFTFSATVSGIIAIGVAATVAIATFVVLSVLIPILYFMNKPAVCMVLLINELTGGDDLKGNEIRFADDYNVDGKPTLLTSSIKGAYISPVGTYAFAGFFASSKASSALIGTQYGFTFSCQYNPRGLTSSTKPLSFGFGVACPLAIGSNKCYCDFNITAKQAALRVADEGSLGSSATNADGVKLVVNCNSPSGSIAYFVARIYR